MPIYEYQCRECGYRLDALQKMSDPLLSDCPECERPALKKLVSAPHFRLKGSGWYETDFKNSGSDKQDGANKDGAGKDAGNGADKSASDTGGKDKADSSSGKESSTSPASDAAAA